MKYYYITGTSRGIGKAVAEALLEDENHQVLGISRNHTIEHSHYTPITLDLNNLDKVREFQFGEHPDAEKIVLVNNAGVLGHVAQVGRMYHDKIIQSYNVNLVSPSILINSFIGQYQDRDIDKMLLNTSSGAARHTIPSWSTYCSTKSGIEMFLRVIEDEQKDFPYPFKIYSVAPGVVDTEMQDEIREVEPENFRELDRFVQLKKEGMLVDPQAVGKKFVDIMEHPASYPKTLMDLRD
ncbi:MAG: SDR family NAD(P)-dependent oxidoreductase [Bacteroidales bacterium]|nr:SDR family NAD(P)-dependent oxidoreductase [Bacteroidales bacterium]